MKFFLFNNTKFISLLLMIFVFAALSISCTTSDSLDKSLETEILQDFLMTSAMIGDISPEKIEYSCLGQFDNSVAIYFHTAGAYKSKTTEKVAGYIFEYPDSRTIKIWNNGRFYNIAEAFEKKLIAENDVESIYNNSIFLIKRNPLFIFEDKETSYVSDIEYTSEYANLIMGAGIGVKLDPNICNGDWATKFAADSKFWRGLDIELVGQIEYGDFTQCGVILPEAYYTSIEEYLYRLVYYKTEIEKIDGVTKAWIAFPDIFPYQANDTHYITTSISPSSKLALERINVQKVWEFTTGSKKIKVGILDSGIASHDDLNGNYSMSFDFYNIVESNPIFQKIDNESHGTHVAGIVGAVGNNATGVCGVNWNVDLIQMRFFNKDFTVLECNEKALQWAIANWDTEYQIRIINYSAGSTSSDISFKNLIEEYSDLGGLLICAAGNHGKDISNASDTAYPAYYGKDTLDDTIENIIVVGALDYSDQLASFSNWGTDTVDIYAPGVSILSTIPTEMCEEGSNIVSTQWGTYYECECEYKFYTDNDNATTDGFQWVPKGSSHVSNGYHYMSGTSMSTPYVTGVAALLLSVNPDLSAAQLKECILNGADQITITTANGTTQAVKKLNSWGAFQYLMTHYPFFAKTIGYSDVTYTYDIDADAEYMKDNTSMMKFVLSTDGKYTFSVSANDEINVEFYSDNLSEILPTQIKSNNNSEIEFTITLTQGTYYLRTNYVDSNSSGTVSVNIDCPTHTHDYSEWTYHSPTQHISCCSLCGETGTTYGAHATKQSLVVGNKATCFICGFAFSLDNGFGQIIHNVQKVSINGSYVLSNGIIVLVDEDVEAYLCGTLVFYDKDKLPEVQ